MRLRTSAWRALKICTNLGELPDEDASGLGADFNPATPCMPAITVHLVHIERGFPRGLVFLPVASPQLGLYSWERGEHFMAQVVRTAWLAFTKTEQFAVLKSGAAISMLVGKHK